MKEQHKNNENSETIKEQNEVIEKEFGIIEKMTKTEREKKIQFKRVIKDKLSFNITWLNLPSR